MSSSATQHTRPLAVFTSLGEDRLLLRRVRGREELSRLFEYELEMIASEDSLAASDIIGTPVQFVVDQLSAQPMRFGGHVTEFSRCGGQDEWSVYRAVVRPWLWFLTQTSDCRIFQRQSAVEIVTRVFRELGFNDYDERMLRGTYPQREYCVQYRETDFAFVSRLLEEEGIFYYFRHEPGRQVLVLADAASAYYDLADDQVDFVDSSTASEVRDRLTNWERHYSFRPGRWAQTDFDFERPTADLRSIEPASFPVANAKNFEIYDYPGKYADRSRGAQLTRVRMQEGESRQDVANGSSTYRSFAPGGAFRVRRHPSAGEVGQAYALVFVEHQASVRGTYDDSAAVAGDSRGELAYENRFTCLPKSVVFRPERTTQRPIVRGAQTAIVVGPPGEEIYPDVHGRVKVQFHWDREGRWNEDSSCWIRVAQTHAGRGWGGIDLPRVGEEVLVDFLEGDPDRPIITGRVYNGENRPPFELPAGKTRSGTKSQTYKGAGYNEISMDDTAGAEQIRIHGQHNMDASVNNNQTWKVGVDRTTQVGNNDVTKIGNDSTESVGNNQSIEVTNNMTTNVGQKLVVNAGASITLKCGASKIHMTAGGVITITGTIITMAAAANAAVAAPLTQIIGGAMLTSLGGINILEGGVTHVGAAALCSVAGGKVDVAGGQTSIKGAPIKLN